MALTGEQDISSPRNSCCTQPWRTGPPPLAWWRKRSSQPRRHSGSLTEEWRENVRNIAVLPVMAAVKMTLSAAIKEWWLRRVRERKGERKLTCVCWWVSQGHDAERVLPGNGYTGVDCRTWLQPVKQKESGPHMEKGVSRASWYSHLLQVKKTWKSKGQFKR